MYPVLLIMCSESPLMVVSVRMTGTVTVAVTAYNTTAVKDVKNEGAWLQLCAPSWAHWQGRAVWRGPHPLHCPRCRPTDTALQQFA